MATIIKKGTNKSAFRLKSGELITLEVNGVLNIIEDKLFEKLMAEYGSFIRPRIISDKNPNGCFIVSEKKSIAVDQDKEVGEIKDKSAPIKIKKKRKGK